MVSGGFWQDSSSFWITSLIPPSLQCLSWPGTPVKTFFPSYANDSCAMGCHIRIRSLAQDYGVVVLLTPVLPTRLLYASEIFGVERSARRLGAVPQTRSAFTASSSLRWPVIFHKPEETLPFLILVEERKALTLTYLMELSLCGAAARNTYL